MVRLHVLEGAGRAVSLCERGAALVSYRFGSAQEGTELLFRYERPEAYGTNPLYLGSTIGRYAGRISDAAFELDGRRYPLGRNDGPHCLHGGPAGLHARDWAAEPFTEPGTVGVRFSIDSPDGDGGFPGELRVVAEYRLRGNGELWFHAEARADRPTPVSLTNHAYWNLRGTGDVKAHRARLLASKRLELRPDRIPTGRVLPVGGTRFDLREGPGNAARSSSGLEGFDDYFIVDRPEEAETRLAPIAAIFEPESGRSLEVLSNAPGFVFYTGDFAGCLGLCVEPSEYPDAPNRDEFPSSVLRPGTARILDIAWRVAG
jgi:aldose 1-epimerase